MTNSHFSAPAALVAAIIIGTLTILGIAIHTLLYGTPSTVFCLMSLFLSINLFICYLEICLFLQRDYIEKRHVYWKKRWQDTGKTPAIEFLSARVSTHNLFSSHFWADCWATYSLYDGSYADRKTYGFSADVGNGFVTLIPSIILHLGITVTLLPANVLGILALIMFWQWLYCTSIYWFSFFIAGRHKAISKADLYTYIWGTNLPWAAFSVLGLYMAIRLILENNYAVLGM